MTVQLYSRQGFYHIVGLELELVEVVLEGVVQTHEKVEVVPNLLLDHGHQDPYIIAGNSSKENFEAEFYLLMDLPRKISLVVLEQKP